MAACNHGDAASSRGAFLAAIEKPLAAPGARNRPPYRVQFPDGGAERLATAFARARAAAPNSPLVPELQVVLNHCLENARRGDDGDLVATVPADAEELHLRIGDALASHLRRALLEAFPEQRDRPLVARRTRASA